MWERPAHSSDLQESGVTCLSVCLFILVIHVYVFIYFMCICMDLRVTVPVWRKQDNLQELVLSLHYVDP